LRSLLILTNTESLLRHPQIALSCRLEKQSLPPKQSLALYRSNLYESGPARTAGRDGTKPRLGFTLEEIAQVIANGGRLELKQALLCRIRYFCAGGGAWEPGIHRNRFPKPSQLLWSQASLHRAHPSGPSDQVVWSGNPAEEILFPSIKRQASRSPLCLLGLSRQLQTGAVWVTIAALLKWRRDWRIKES